MSYIDGDDYSIVDVYIKSIVTVLVDDVWLVAKDVSAILGQPIFMISAWNPGIQLSEEENSKLSQELETSLASQNFDWHHAQGKDPDSDYSEPSYVITNISETDALEIAREYKQIAIFRITSHELTVIMCETNDTKSRSFSE